MSILGQIRRQARRRYYRVRLRNRPRIFCIGRNKTGTTSIKSALLDLGFVVGDQRQAEILYDRHYFAGEFGPIVDYCRSAEAFQDVPFSCPGTYRHLDRAFPGARFILSVRDSPEQWYRSLTRFHARLYGGGAIPSYADLQKARYVRPGFMTHIVRLYGTSPEDPYAPAAMMASYARHNAEVLDHFAGRPDQLLVVNLAEPDAYSRFKDFLGVAAPGDSFPRVLPGRRGAATGGGFTTP